MKAVLRTDGGARGNPGPAGAGFVLEDDAGTCIASGGRFLGTTTNNVAEYEALLLGLGVARDKGVTHLVVFSDSELLVRQMNGVYRVKHPNMKPLFERAQALAKSFVSLEVRHVPRAMNAAADELANRAMDEQCDVGSVGECEPGPTQGILFD